MVAVVVGVAVVVVVGVGVVKLLLCLLLLTTEPTSLMVIAHDLATMQAENGRLHELTIYEITTGGEADSYLVQLQWTVPAFEDSLTMHVYVWEDILDTAQARTAGVNEAGQGAWSLWSETIE